MLARTGGGVRSAAARAALALAASAALALAACGGSDPEPRVPQPVSTPPPRDAPPVLPLAVTEQESGTDALIQAVSAVDENVVWASGHEGAYLRTTDGGRTWRAGLGPGPDSLEVPQRAASRDASAALEFRDVHAVDARTAFLLSAGPGERSRIYRTTDAGRTWTLRFRNDEPDAFFDCMDFWDERRGVAFSDAVEGEFVIIRTDDAGETWTRLPPERVADARPGEAGFAASGTCVVVGPEGRAWIGTGGTDTARVLRTTDYGRTWRATPVPRVAAGEIGGVFSVAFRDTLHGVAVGGDLEHPDSHLDERVARTEDGGRSWVVAGRPSFGGPVYGVAYVPDAPTPTLVAVGPNGMDVSTDEGRSWTPVDSLSYWAVGFAPGGTTGWATGPDGRIVRLEWD